MTTAIADQLRALAGDIGFTMQVPALKGEMGDVSYYVVVLPYSTVVRYVTTSDSNLPPRERENRRPRPARFAEISKYIQNNRFDYRFSALTCTYGRNGTQGPMSWRPAQESGDASRIGILTLDQRDPLIIVDGQHRLGAIKQAVEDDPSLGDEMIPIVLFPYLTVLAAQQLFSDLNRTAKKTTKSLDILFDHRDISNRIVQKVVDQVSFFGERTNLEDASVPINSSYMFTLSSIYQASKPVIDAAASTGMILKDLNSDNEDEYVAFLSEVWEFIGSHFEQWEQVATYEEDIRIIRSQYVHWHSGVISTIGEVVAMAMKEFADGWKNPISEAIKPNENFGWERGRPDWQGVILAGNSVMPRSVVRPQLRAFLKKRGGMTLTRADESNLESIANMRQEIVGD